MLIFVGWSALVVWLNVRPRWVTEAYSFDRDFHVHTNYYVHHGCPWIWGVTYTSDLKHFCSPHYFIYWPLAGNIAIGLLAVVILAFASKYLVRAIVAALRAFMSKPPPRQEEGD